MANMSVGCANDLMVIELKKELRKLGLSGTGCKNELITRLNESTHAVCGLSNNRKLKRLKTRKRLLARGASINDG